MKFSLRQIAIFAAIARCGSVSQAAERLAMSQSAASNALLELERAYERPLFDRIGKSLHLNSDGRGLLPSAERLLGLAADIDSLLAGDRPGPLAVGATLTIGNYLATLLVADYLRQNPDSPATLHVANTHQIVASLLAFDCDLGLIEGEVSHPDLHCEPWLEDELLVFCAPGHPLAAAGRADNATLAAQDWILREPGSNSNTPKRSSAPSNPASASAACRGWHCAKPCAGAAWSKSPPRNSPSAASSTSPATGSGTKAWRCGASGSFARASPRGRGIPGSWCCRLFPEGWGFRGDVGKWGFFLCRPGDGRG